MSARTKIDIMNRALSNLGAKSIVTDNEETRNFRIMDEYFEDSLRSVLEEDYWPFATKRADLVVDSGSALAFDDLALTYQYVYPTDCVRIIGYSDSNAITRIEGNVIFSDTDDLGLTYIFYLDTDANYTIYPASFVDAVADKLAADAGFMVLNSTAESKILLEKYYSVTLPRAKEINIINARGQTPQTDPTKLSIMNRALSNLGIDPGPSNPDNEKNFRVLNDYFVTSLKSVLEETFWNFATRRVLLTLLTPDTWFVGTTYSATDQVLYDSVKYDSYVADNVGHAPDHSDTDDNDLTIEALTGGTVQIWKVVSDSAYFDVPDIGKSVTTYDSDGDIIGEIIISNFISSTEVDGTEVVAFTELTAEGGTWDIKYWEKYVEPAWEAYDLNYTYLLPSDYVNVVGWNEPSAVVRFEETDIEGTATRVIRSNTASLGLLYICYSTSYSSYPASFLEAFADKLASDVAFTVLNRNSKSAGQAANIATSVLSKYINVSLPKAMLKNAQCQTPQSPLRDSWLNSKWGGSGRQEIRYR